MKINPYGKSPFFDSFLKKLAGPFGEDFLTDPHPEESPDMMDIESEDEIRSEQNSLGEMLPKIDHAISQLQKAATGEIDPNTLDFGYLESVLTEIKSGINREDPTSNAIDSIDSSPGMVDMTDHSEERIPF